LDQAVRRHNDEWKKALENSIGKELGMKPGEVLLACVGVNDYAGAFTNDACVEKREKLIKTSFNSETQESAGGLFSWMLTDRCSQRERIGPQERIYRNVKLVEKEAMALVLIDGREQERSAGFNALDVSREPSSNILGPKDSRVPAKCEIRTLSMSEAKDRSEWLKQALDQSARNGEFASLEAIIEKINVERARIAVATSALIFARNKERELKKVVAELGG
jgi:hypothetical protein